MPVDEVDDSLRRRAKAINFGLIYGMSAFGLANQIKVERAEAQDYIDSYFARYTGVKAFMDAMRKKAAEQGYVETLHGRRLYLPEIKSRNYNRRQYAERTAINAPLQGSAADLIKLAMIATQSWLDQHCPDARMILQVHDELVLEVPKAKLELVQSTLPGLMTDVADLAVPLVVDVGVGANWSVAH